MEKLTHKGIIGSIDYVKDDAGNIEVIAIHTDQNGDGQCYKDSWDCGDVIYVSENGAIDFNLHIFSDIKINDVKFEDVAWTRENWLDWVKEELRWECEGTAIWTDDGFIEYVARAIYDDVEWEDLSTRFNEWVNGNDIEEIYETWRKNK